VVAPGATSYTFDPVEARYFRIRKCTTTGSHTLFNQMMLFSPMISPVVVTDFTVADQSTGSTLFTNSATVDVTAFDASTTVEGAAINGYLITESDTPPTLTADWLAEPPTTHIITGGQGGTAIYGWAKDSNDEISAPKIASIYFSTATPVVSNVVITPGDPGTAVATWDTNIPAEGSVVVREMPAGSDVVFPESALGVSHSVTLTGLADGVNYRLTIINNEMPGYRTYWPGSPYGGDMTVIGYSWLQLPADYITPSYGSTTGLAITNGYGDPNTFRWGDHIWIPDWNCTDSGNADYWAVITLDKPRNVFMVRTDWWAQEETALRRFYIDGSVNGTDWVEIGSYDFGDFLTLDRTVADVPVTDGDYLAVRVRVMAGDYQTNRSDRGGPGLNTIEPIGDGGLYNYEVNWANRGTFGTTVKNTNLNFGGANYNDGYVYERGDRAGCTLPWPDGSYLEIDLKTNRSVGKVVVVWEWSWMFSSYITETSTDGVTYTEVTNASFTVHRGSCESNFDAVDARYVRITDGTGSGHSILNQMMIYSATPPPPSVEVTAFGIADQTTGSVVFTNSATVNVTAFDATTTIEGAEINGYLITETDTVPDLGATWATEAPATCTIAGAEGQVTLYAWAKDDTDSVGGPATAAILFSTAAPVMSDLAIADNGDGTATATWNTDIAAQAALNYGPVSMAGTTPNTVTEAAVGLAHSLTFAISAGVNYKIVPVNNEVASAAVYWPEPWPIEGDANMDCRVNILDLIFIRNKLNQSPDTGDNWPADVNKDTRINILDLIFVRNKLNTQCPQ